MQGRLECVEGVVCLNPGQRIDGGTSNDDGGTTTDGSPGCGDGTRGENKSCDGVDFGGETCASRVAPGWIGTLTCTATCTLATNQCTPPPSTYSPFVAGANWSKYTVATLPGGAMSYGNGASDGRYLYLLSNPADSKNNLVVRHDTQAPFGSAGSWASFDVASVDANARGFASAAFDGRYIYLVPRSNDGTYHGTVARYDTRAGFDTGTSWTTFDVSTVNPGAKGFQGAVFDGRYLYLVPYGNPTSDGIVARYDTTADFRGGAASWSTFDVSTRNPLAKGFIGGTFDGRYVYLVPYSNGSATSPYHGIVTRYDTQGGFAAATSWSTFDASSVNAGAKGFAGGIFDGRYVYFVPNVNNGFHGTGARRV